MPLTFAGMTHSFTRRFNDDIFTIKVGWAKNVFKVHKNVLNLSPVLACMTTSFFSEGITKEIALPEDDSDSFGRVIEHLYGNNDAALNVDLLDSDGTEKLADLYGLAEKYQLPGLKHLVVQKLEQLDSLKVNRMTFFHMAHKICQSTRESDEIFVPYFTHQALIHLASMSITESQELSEIVHSGGLFAKAICQLQEATYRKAQRDWIAEKLSLKRSGDAAERELGLELKKTKKDFEKAQRLHKSQHPACLYCHVLL